MDKELMFANDLKTPMSTVLIHSFVICAMHLVFVYVKSKNRDIPGAVKTVLTFTLACTGYIGQSFLLDENGLFCLCLTVSFYTGTFLAVMLAEKVDFNINSYIPAIIFLCFTVEKINSLDDFIVFLTVTLKYLAVLNYYSEREFEKRRIFIVISYLMFPTWMTYDLFQTISDARFFGDVEWKRKLPKLMVNACLLYCHYFWFTMFEQYEYPRYYFLMALVFAAVRRFKYYYYAQLAEIGLMAAGINDYQIYNIWISEWPLTKYDLLMGLNKPLARYFYGKRFSFTFNKILVVFYTHIVVFACYIYGVATMILVLLFFLSIKIQDNALEASARHFGPCPYQYCQKYCYHSVGNSSTLDPIIKTLYTLLNICRYSIPLAEFSILQSCFILINIMIGDLLIKHISSY